MKHIDVKDVKNTTIDSDRESVIHKGVNAGRRRVMTRLGLTAAFIYVTPVLLSLAPASASGGGGDGGGGGGGGGDGGRGRGEDRGGDGGGRGRGEDRGEDRGGDRGEDRGGDGTNGNIGDLNIEGRRPSR